MCPCRLRGPASYWRARSRSFGLGTSSTTSGASALRRIGSTHATPLADERWPVSTSMCCAARAFRTGSGVSRASAHRGDSARTRAAPRTLRGSFRSGGHGISTVRGRRRGCGAAGRCRAVRRRARRFWPAPTGPHALPLARPQARRRNVSEQVDARGRAHRRRTRRAALAASTLSIRPSTLAALRFAPQRWRIIAALAPGEDDAEALAPAAIARRVAATLGDGPFETEWASTFAIHRRRAANFVVGRVALLGDAAHLNSPVGAQGLNAGVADAHNLAWKLTNALRGGDWIALLASYERERRFAIVNSTGTLDRSRHEIAVALGDARGGSSSPARASYAAPQSSSATRAAQRDAVRRSIRAFADAVRFGAFGRRARAPIRLSPRPNSRRSCSAASSPVRSGRWRCPMGSCCSSWIPNTQLAGGRGHRSRHWCAPTVTSAGSNVHLPRLRSSGACAQHWDSAGERPGRPPRRLRADD